MHLLALLMDTRYLQLVLTLLTAPFHLHLIPLSRYLVLSILRPCTMADVYSGLPPKRCMKMKRGDIPLIAILESDCSGGTPDHVMIGDRIFTRAQPDHKRYWREMVGTYLRHEMDLDLFGEFWTSVRQKKLV